MAMQCECKLQMGKDRFDGIATMSPDHIDFRGMTKYRFRLSEIRNARIEEENILFSFHGTPATIALPNVRTAEVWYEQIQHPQSLADKLGIRSGDVVKLVNLDDAQSTAALGDCKARIVNDHEAVDVIVVGIDRPSELFQLEDLRGILGAHGVIWVILPKTAKTITKANVIASAREVGLLHSESLDFSETHTGHRLVQPGQARRKANGNGTARG